RRHTRFSRDWSSDVCSSDLLHRRAADRAEHGAVREVDCDTRTRRGVSRGVPDYYDGRTAMNIDRRSVLLSLAALAAPLPRFAWRSEERRVGKSVDFGWQRVV